MKTTTRIASLVLLLLLGGGLAAQIKGEPETVYTIAGCESIELVGGVAIVPEGSKPKLKAVGRIQVECQEGDEVSVIADKGTDPVEVAKISDCEFLILGNGKIRVEVVTVNWDSRKFTRTRHLLEIGDVPEPEPDNPEPDDPDEPTPAPNVPPDAFDNLGQRIDKLADELNLQVDLRARVAEIYADVAGKMRARPPKILRTQDAVAEVITRINGLRLGGEWKAVQDLINRDGSGRTLPFQSDDGVDAPGWYIAVASGLKG